MKCSLERLMFLGNSGVGKSSFIHHYCRGHFPNSMSSTVGKTRAPVGWW
uniref:Uncharacterized protein n=1 Tax=Denticeps clupeoides TaxID=299321 RepID=A0AAY4BQZ9_9TELE